MTKQPWLCKAIPEEVWGKAWNPPPCPSSPLPAWFLLPWGVSTSPCPLPFSPELPTPPQDLQEGPAPIPMGLSLPRATECYGQGMEEEMPFLSQRGPLGAVLGPLLRMGYPGSPQQGAKGHLPTQNGMLFHTKDKNSRFEPQHSWLLTVSLGKLPNLAHMRTDVYPDKVCGVMNEDNSCAVPGTRLTRGRHLAHVSFLSAEPGTLDTLLSFDGRESLRLIVRLTGDPGVQASPQCLCPLSSS